MDDKELGIGFLLNDVSRYFRIAFEKDIVRSGLETTPGEIRALSCISAYPNSRQTFLADLMGIEAMTMSSYIDRLVYQGFVTRTVDPADRRANVIGLTDKATIVLATVEPVASRIFDQATINIDAAEMVETGKCLQAIVVNLREGRSQLSSDKQP
jgi:DNA-binding MarR family transcriptional regulator